MRFPTRVRAAETGLDKGEIFEGSLLNRSIRVLLVEDFFPFRDLLRITLEKMPGFEIVGESSDGIEALQKIRELNPDLILLDVGLPNLSGIEIARHLQNSSAHSIILFVSHFCDWDIIEYAFRYGASGYVVKSDAAAELVPAIESVRQRMPFISTTAVRHILDERRRGGPSRMLNRISAEIAMRGAVEPAD
jgi:DNA-binding NarL/FixJ family response regulator